jgi:hypothetical protein
MKHAAVQPRPRPSIEIVPCIDGAGTPLSSVVNSIFPAINTAASCGVSAGIPLRDKKALHMSRLCVSAGYWRQ